MAENHYLETCDQWGRTTSRKGFPDGPGGTTVVEEKYEYDLAGNLARLTDANNNDTLYDYDALNRLVKVTNPLGEATDYDYDRLGDLTQIIQYQGATAFPTVNQYSERGALVSKQPPAGQPITYEYNANVLPVEVTDASGKITTTQYYQDNKVAQVRANQDRIDYYYSHLGGVEKYQPVNDTTGNGEYLTYGYYSTGLTSQRRTANYSVNFQYDVLGNRTKVTDPFNFATDYQYNSLNRLTTVTAGEKNFTYEYYGDGMVKAVNYPQLAGGTSLRTEYTYDNINRLTTMKNIMSGQTITQYDYGYDNNGNITSVTENGQTTYYAYDSLNRLTGIQRPGGEQLIYQYDTRGNRSLASAHDKGLDGFIPGSFGYNNWEQLAAFTAGGQTYNYSYDPEGLRNKKVTPSGTTRYHYDNNGRVVAESNASGAVTAQTIWGKQALARKADSNYYYYLYNGHGDVTRVIDQNGNIVDSYTYDEWGNILSKQESMPQPLKYAGEYYDDESGLYYLRARYYDPTIGRFISKEPYEGEITNPLSLNLYTYVTNNPLIYVDPSGNYLVGLRDYIESRGGSIYWDDESGIATAALNHYVGQYYIDDYTVENGHIMVDDAELMYDFYRDETIKLIGPTDEQIEQFRQTAAEAVFTGGLGTLERRGVGSLAGKAVSKAESLAVAGKVAGKGFSTFSALKNFLGSPGNDKIWHHIVEQCQINKSGFSLSIIHNTDNVIALDKATHIRISAYYNSIDTFTNGMRVRNWLAGQSYEVQYKFGLDVLKRYGITP
jgi:RHS repeat-associated protein